MAEILRMLVAVALVVLFAGTAHAASTEGGGAFAPQKKKQKAKQKLPAKERDKALKCVVLTVRAPQRDRKGRSWDSAVRSGPQPDIRITELSTGTVSRDCDNSFRCSLRVRPRGASLRLRIVDVDDFKSDEMIGQGTCVARAGRCRLELATVSITPCR